MCLGVMQSFPQHLRNFLPCSSVTIGSSPCQTHSYSRLLKELATIGSTYLMISYSEFQSILYLMLPQNRCSLTCPMSLIEVEANCAPTLRYAHSPTSPLYTLIFFSAGHAKTLSLSAPFSSYTYSQGS